ncbi:MAG TPA: cytochrome P450 [Bordetella sp.]
MTDAAIAAAAPELDIDPYEDAVLESPFAMFEAIRQAPAVYLKRHDVYAIGRHREVQAAMKDWQTFSSTGGIGLTDVRKPDTWRARSPIGDVDPPDHTKVRTVMQRILSPQVIRAWRAGFEEEAERLLDELVGKEYVDGVQDLAEAYVSTSFPKVMGIRHTPQLRENWYLMGELNFDSQGPRNARYLATQQRADELISDWQQASMQRESLLPGGFGIKIFEAADAGAMAPELAPLLIRSFLRGGLDTTTSMLSAVLWYLARDPSQYARLREDPALARPALDEAMRLETPSQTAYRLTMRDVVVDGTRIPADKKVMLQLGAANRDPAFWDRPDAFDVQRNPVGHLALGHGIHMCIGQMVARLEGECVLNALTRRVSRLGLEGPPARKLNNALRGFKTLPLRLQA